ncbi:MAG: hypothetical protein WBN51_08655 [Gammaproteobacteria bacterium]
MKNKIIIIFMVLSLPIVCLAEAYQSTLLVQTGKLRESDLIVRTITDLESSKICLAFYVRTSGTSPVMSCYDSQGGFASNINQVGSFKEGNLVVRKMKDTFNDVSCLVAYVSTAGTSPSIDCYRSRKAAKDDMVRSGHLREGDLDIYRVVDADSTKTCLVGYVAIGGTSPSLVCYDSKPGGKGGLVQNSYLREGDLIVRKIVDKSNGKECLVTYVSTEGTSPFIHCSDTVFANQSPSTKSPVTVNPSP